MSPVAFVSSMMAPHPLLPNPPPSRSLCSPVLCAWSMAACPSAEFVQAYSGSQGRVLLIGCFYVVSTHPPLCSAVSSTRTSAVHHNRTLCTAVLTLLVRETEPLESSGMCGAGCLSLQLYTAVVKSCNLRVRFFFSTTQAADSAVLSGV